MGEIIELAGDIVERLEKAETYNVRQAADRLGISERGVRRYIKEGLVQGTQARGPGGMEWRVPRAAIERLVGERGAIEGQQVGGAPDVLPLLSEALSPLAGEVAGVRAILEESLGTAERVARENEQLKAKVAALEGELAALRTRGLWGRVRNQG